jgi:hypothetical protein
LAEPDARQRVLFHLLAADAQQPPRAPIAPRWSLLSGAVACHLSTVVRRGGWQQRYQDQLV